MSPPTIEFGDRDVLAILRGICALPPASIKSPYIEELLEIVRAIRLPVTCVHCGERNEHPKHHRVDGSQHDFRGMAQVRFPTRDGCAVIAWLLDELDVHSLERGNLLGLLHRMQRAIELAQVTPPRVAGTAGARR